MINLSVFRKGLIGFICTGVILAFASCSKTSQTSSNEDTLDRIHRTGQIDACTVEAPPFVIKDLKTGQFSGINIDAMNMIADRIKAKVNWHETTFGNTVGDLVSRRCDVVVTDLFLNIPRAATVAFTLPPVQYLGLSAIVRKNDRRFQNVKDVYEFDKPNLEVAVATGEGGDFFVRDHFKKAKIKRVDVDSSDLTRAFLEVTANRADVGLAGADMTSLFAKSHPEVTDLFQNRQYSLNPIGWPVRSDDMKWLHFLESSLYVLDAQGIMSELERKYHAHIIHRPN